MSNSLEATQSIDILGSQIEFKTDFLKETQAYCVSSLIIPAGVTVPLHSHKDRKTIYITSGTLEVFEQGAWLTLGAGDFFDVQASSKHAFRNLSAHRVAAILVTTAAMAVFFSRTGRPTTGAPPTPAEVEAFIVAAAKHNFWLGSAMENAAIGISLRATPKMKRPANMTH